MAVRAKVRFRPPVQVSGAVPPLVEGFFPRDQPSLALGPGETAVLVHGDATYAAPVSQGGTGKTQLAVAFCQALQDRRTVEVLAWVNAADREAVVTGFAQAVSLVDAGHWGESAESAAARFVAWLQRTRRSWVLILDDLADLGDLRELWPAGPAGQVLITTRLPASAFAGPAPRSDAASGNRAARVLPVPGLRRVHRGFHERLLLQPLQLLPGRGLQLLGRRPERPLRGQLLLRGPALRRAGVPRLEVLEQSPCWQD